MALTPIVSELLEVLQIGNTNEEKCMALNKFHSNFTKANLSEQITEEDFQILYQNLICAYDEELKQEVCTTLSIILLDQRYKKPSLFQSVQQIAIKTSKLKVFTILENIDQEVLATVVNDPRNINCFSQFFESINPMKMTWLSPTSCTDNLQKLVDGEKKSMTEDEEIGSKITFAALNFLERIYKCHDIISPNQILLNDLIIMDRVLLLVYMGHRRQREAASKLLRVAINTGIGERIRQNHQNIWIAYKKMLQDTFAHRMSLLVASCYADWSIQWELSILLLGKDLHRGAQLINNLLSVEEKAFKSSDPNIRRQAFYSWKLLVDNFALDPQELASARRIKLLCVPLIAKNSKTEIIAYAKFEVWWHLIVKVYSDLPKFVNSILTPFLNFCFGPLGDTPLLSTKQDICPSPGKRFPKTRLASLDALFQLLVDTDADDYNDRPSVLKEKLPHAITSEILEESSRTFIHSVFEAFLILGQFEETEIPRRQIVGKIMWKTLISKIEETKPEIKSLIYKDVLLAVTEVTGHISNKTLAKDLLFDVVLVSLPNAKESFIFSDEILENVISVVLNQLNLEEKKKIHFETIGSLLSLIIKPNKSNTVKLRKLHLLKLLLEKLEKVNPDSRNTNLLIEVWCMLADISTQYMESCLPINEGDAAQHDFTTIEAILIYPLSHFQLEDKSQIQKIIQSWRSMYKQFDMLADLETTVKPNEIFNRIVNILRNSVKKQKKCYPLLSGCLNSLITTINYQCLIEQEISPVIHLIDELIICAFEESHGDSIDIVLRSLSALLITIYGLNLKKAIDYLSVIRSTLELLFRQKTGGYIEKEIAETWETVVTIFKGLNKNFTYDLLASFQKCIVLALCHTNQKIVSLALQILDMNNNLDERTSKLLSELASFKNKSVDNVETKGSSKTKQVKVAGSFLNRKSTASPTPHNAMSPSSNKAKKLTSLPPPSDSDSQDYVLINSEVKFDVNRLTDHQKESLKKKRDDIPALYNDLSQSESHDTQELQNWFDKKQIPETELNIDRSNDPNKENKGTISEFKFTKVTITDGESSEIDQVTQNNSDKEATEIESVMENPVVKKLDFESREEFPEDKDLEDNSPSILENAKRRNRNLSSKSNENNEEHEICTHSTSHKSKKRSKSSSKDSQNEKKVNKRKIDDEEGENQKKKKFNSSESSDNESVKSTESDEILNKRVKSEISRLQIDMVRSVFEPLPNRRRSKIFDCSCKDPNCKKNHPVNVNKSKSKTDTKSESAKRPNRLSLDAGKKRTRRNSKQEGEEDKKSSRKSLPKLEIYRSSDIQEQKLPSEFKTNDLQELNGSGVNLPVIEGTQDLEEIVENSQDSNSRLKSSNRMSDKKLLIKIDKMNSNAKNEASTSEIDKLDNQQQQKQQQQQQQQQTKEPVIEEDIMCHEQIDEQISEPKREGEEEPPMKSNTVQLSSPKGIVKRNKIKVFPLQGRAAQMLGLVTKQGLMEKDAKAEDENRKLVLQISKKSDSESVGNSKKMNSKDSEKPPTSQIGSRQEKIFNNMKSADYCSSPGKMFVGLKNDGEKISPNVHKNSSDIITLSEKATLSEKESSSIDLSPTWEGKELPILEWSSANPPSLTASPSAGILKRYNHSLPEMPGESEIITPNKRKRVSFADPPVSQEMGYEVNTGESPHKISKTSRSHSIRRETPLKSRQNKTRMFQADSEKVVVRNESQLDVSNEVEVKSEKTDDCEDSEQQVERNNHVSEKSHELTEIPDDLPFTDDNLMKIHGEISCPESSTPVRITVDSSKEILITETSSHEVKIEPLEIKPVNLVVEEIFGTQEDMFGAVDTSDESLKMLNLSGEKKEEKNSDSIISPDSIKFNTTNDSLSDTGSSTKDASKNESLEDTVDVQNVSAFDSTDEAFCGKPVRCSTRTTTDGEQDTLPVTDSVFGSISQETQNTQAPANIPKPEFLDSTQPIFPSLLECKEPVTSIVESLANPLWVNHLVSNLASREIRTIGDLASLTEREVNRIPVKGNPKVTFVKSILARFESSRAGVAAANSEIVLLEKTPLEGTIAPTQSSSVYPRNENSVPIPALSSNLLINTSKNVLTNEGTSKSAIQSQKVQPRIMYSKSVSVQMEMEDLLDEIDVNLVLQSAARRCSPESLLAHYKTKMRGLPDSELEAETLRMLGIDKPLHSDLSLKAVCKACGLNKVLLKLPNIFSSDKQFFIKVLSTYRKKIPVRELLDALDINELKDAFCQKCKSSELAEMLGKTLQEEEENGFMEPMSEFSNLTGILKRMPADLLISHTVANDELIPSHIVLDIALQNNSDVAIAQTLNAQSEVKKESVFHKLWTTTSAVNHVTKEATEKEMMDIIRTLSLRLKPEKLLEAFRDSMSMENDSSEKVLLALFKLISAKLQPDQLLDVFYECMKDKMTSS